jgi:hypothetical protein
LGGGSDREVLVALNGRDFVSAERDIRICAPTEMRCADTPFDPIHAGRDDPGLTGVVHYCRNESTCAVVGASCATIPEEALCGGWHPEPPAPLCRDAERCTPPSHIACAPKTMCTYCSWFTVCAFVRNPPAVFRYYNATVLAVQPSGGFIDGGTTVTLVGEGFDGFNGNVNNTLAKFGNAQEFVSELSAETAVVRSPPHPAYHARTVTTEIVNGTAVEVSGGLAVSEGDLIELMDLESDQLVVSMFISLNGIDFELAAAGVSYRYYTHRSLRLEPFGGPSVGGTAVSVVGEGFEGYDGQASSARCMFGELVVPVDHLFDELVDCVSPPAIRRLTPEEAEAARLAAEAREAEAELLAQQGLVVVNETEIFFDENGTQMPFEPPPPFIPPPPFMPFPPAMPPLLANESNLTIGVVVESDVPVDYGPPVDVPEWGVVYRWYSGNLTDLTTVWEAPQTLAVNEVDFRGSLFFKYYHQVMQAIAVMNSSEWGMFSELGDAEFAGGSPYGGYPITILGSGFDGYDGNATTVKVRFTTEIPTAEELTLFGNGTNGTNATNATSFGNATLQLAAGAEYNATDMNGTAAVIEVNGSFIVELTPERIVLLAPEVSLEEGEIYTSRGYPCWNPPCRRTVVTVAINGVDFVGRPAPMVFFFFNEPWRLFSMMEQELLLLLFILGALSVINALLTWQWRFETYERYLKLKYKIKNKVIYPLVFRKYGRMA